jgi:hypothetical protein
MTCRFRRSMLIPPTVLAAFLTGCGSNPVGPTPSPSPVVAATPPPLVTTTLFKGGTSGLGPNTIAESPVVTTSARGTLRGHVNWTFAEDHIAVYLTDSACSFDQLKASRCNVVALSESRTPKPRDVVYENAPPGGYILWVGNLGPNTESISVEVTLTTGGSASSVTHHDRLDAAYGREFKDSVAIP